MKAVSPRRFAVRNAKRIATRGFAVPPLKGWWPGRGKDPRCVVCGKFVECFAVPCGSGVRHDDCQPRSDIPSTSSGQAELPGRLP